MGLIDPGSDGSANNLLHRIAVTDAFGGCLGKREGYLWLDVVEHMIFFGEGAGTNLWANLDSAGGTVDCAEDRDEPLFGQRAAVFEVFLGNLSDGLAVNKEQPALDSADDLGDSFGEVYHPSVFCDQNSLLRNTGLLGQLAVCNQVSIFAVHRHHVLWLQDVVAVKQLARGSVTRYVHLGVALVHDVCAEFG